LEVEVALDGQAELAAHRRDLQEANIAELRSAEAEVAEAKLCRA
jgi:hypothetical protein